MKYNEILYEVILKVSLHRDAPFSMVTFFIPSKKERLIVCDDMIKNKSYLETILDDKFDKMLFGRKWRCHQKKMKLCKEPLQYLAKFLDGGEK